MVLFFPRKSQLALTLEAIELEHGCCEEGTNDAFEEGYDAYWEGVDVSDNPYEEDTDEHCSWEEGWRAARKHDYDESEG
ncbi:MAG: hypothetical protein ABSG67_22655 [Thermoguttaceae bacterium]